MRGDAECDRKMACHEHYARSGTAGRKGHTMRITMTGRHMEMTDALRAYIENALQKLRTHFDRVIDVDVVLAVEKYRHIAEINLHANGIRIHGKESSSDMYASVDAVMDKLDKQIRKFKDRIRKHQPRSAKEQRNYEHRIIEMLPDEAEVETDAPMEIAPLHREVKQEKVLLKSMSVDEAIMQLELVDDSFLVFLNADTHAVNIIYARDDSTYGVIEPQI